MTNQEDNLMELEIDGRMRTVFGTLNPQMLEGDNGRIGYNGIIRLLEETFPVSASSYMGGSTSYSGLQGVLENARRINSDVNGIILAGHSGIDGAIEGLEWWQSYWQPYIVGN